MANTSLILIIATSLCFIFFSEKLYSEENKLDGLDTFVEKAMEEYQVPGVAVAVVKDGEVVYLKGFGVREIGKDAKVDPDTIFQLASVTKTFTAAAVGTMVDKGKVGFDDEVITILLGFALMEPYPTRYSTPRDLLAHRTGLPAFAGDLLGELGYDRAEVLHRVRFIKPSYSFREEAAYSNVGFFTAGQVAAVAADSTWEDVVRDNILKPLEMSRSGFTNELAKHKNVAAPHGKLDGEIKLVRRDTQQILGAAGAMISTASDMTHYMNMFLAGGKYKDKLVLTSDTIKEMFAPSMVEKPGFAELPPISEKTGFSYGMGWGNYHWKNLEIVEKGGALAGIRSVIVLVPELNLGITVLANLNLTVLPEAIRAYILEQYLGKANYDMQAEIMERAKNLAYLTGKPLTLPENPKQPSKPLSAYVGSYENDLYGTFNVVEDKDSLKIEAGLAKYPGTLKHWDYDMFLLKWPSINTGYDEVIFVIDGKGNVSEFLTESYGTFKRVGDKTP
jgi:CubicO group peptidase (beta-lactamase class C family)